MPNPTLKMDSVTVLDKDSDGVHFKNSIVHSSTDIKPAFSAPDTSGVSKDTTLPIFACRAWANFDAGTVDGSNDCTINASANITRINRYATGKYKVYFTTDFPDTNYVACGAFYNRILSPNHSDITKSIYDFYLLYSGSATNGGNSSSIAFFR